MSRKPETGILKRKKRQPSETLLIAFTVLWFGLMIVVPFTGIVKQVLNKNWKQAAASLVSPAALHSFGLTAFICLSTAAISTFFGILTAVVLTRQQFRGIILIERILDLPFAVSPVVIGFMLIILFGPHGWLGSLLNRFGLRGRRLA